MPTIQTIIFEDIDIDVQTNKQLCIHPIHRCLVATPFPIKFSFAVLSSAYDLPPGTYTCKHTLVSEDKKKEVASLIHKPAVLDKPGGIGFRTSFENIEIPAGGRYILRTEIGKYKGDEISIRFETVQERKPSQTLGRR
ncbi:hypothetical protein D3C72_914560 [compost metagenome]|jgi:hypothetical protein